MKLFPPDQRLILRISLTIFHLFVIDCDRFRLYFDVELRVILVICTQISHLQIVHIRETNFGHNNTWFAIPSSDWLTETQSFDVWQIDHFYCKCKCCSRLNCKYWNRLLYPLNIQHRTHHVILPCLFQILVFRLIFLKCNIPGLFFHIRKVG